MRKWLALGIVLFAATALADAKKLTVKIDGMTCPSCAASVEGQFKKLKQVDSVDINIRKGTATLTLKDGQDLDDTAVTQAVKDAGYKAVSIERN